MSMFDEASALALTMKMRGSNQADMAKMLGVSPSYIANKLRLLTLDESSKRIIEEAGLTERHARSVLQLKDTEKRILALEKIVSRKLNVAESEALIDFMQSENFSRELRGAERIKRVNIFLEGLRESVKSLCSAGIYSTEKISYYGTTTMITICIDESK